MRRIPFLLASAAAISLTAFTPAVLAQPTAESTSAAESAEQEAASISAFFEVYDRAQLEMSPAAKSYRGIRDDDYGKWTDPSDEAEEARFQLMQDTAADMRATFDKAELDEDDALSFRLYEMMAERSALLHPFSQYAFVFDHRRGAHTSVPAFLINIHRVSELSDAEAYVSRIEGIGPYLDTMTEQARERADAGIMPPDWVYPYVIADIENLLAAGDENAVLEDFRSKILEADLGADIARLDVAANRAWFTQAVPAYERLLAEIKRQQAFAPTDDGVWRLPDGDKYYAARLKSYTTTDLTADEIHNIGLREVERIHGEMRAIMEKVGFEGRLQDFFEFTRTDDRFFYTSREEYIADAREKIDTLGEKMPEFFGTLPEAPMVIKAVEAFREKSAGKAFYQGPSPDGSRPGTYYVNLYNLRDMSKNELEALAYHEGLPGHHLQRTIQTELGDSMAPFRRFGGVTAYTEGWGLYSEELGKDMGFYQDPYSDFGRLGMELWRACRLVVDTGLHSKRWTREEAIDYLAENTPNPQGDIVKAIERYITTPGQATAYMIGKLKIMELRSMAMAELGDDFDYRGFHDAVLLSGPVPLDILEENVEKWVQDTKAS
ncbi:DUF885 domain-containing protein [Erythrobacter rubeus]|uniref:DUF885 domain-containing protein n=1 Tax=Erythrobacter rubeus TaxID=2760803 RepID=A0ABR8KVC4_9SPHN|nr:DUF885 domain-containing protein [Erythrobacter rubeus]MBD2843163.1 DUF885 domain-containing protein [Erythrobacter rubeus]